MDVQQQIAIFTYGVYISLGVMILGFGFAIFAFFKYRIPMIFALMTGRVQRKTIEKMRESGQLRSSDEQEEDAAQAEASVEGYGDDKDYSTEPIGAMPVMGRPEQETTLLPPEVETTILAPEPETTMLQPEPETTILASEQETTMLSFQQSASDSEMDGEAETSVLSAEELQPGRNGGVTEALSQEDMPEYMRAEQERRAKYRFEIIEHTLITHTDEKI